MVRYGSLHLSRRSRGLIDDGITTDPHEQG
ncbi:hypothetical protein N801_03930 [Knoellia aerolata DSM 18566]|uniref:Uncharacterized protein n=1 Tax=Knoellia aerolata DSM 18566 TaxID=1385519 RepID=A0A0A0JXC3_9MICO|nr:hypothetical protein N801_03930 [Knoellia aerolata DSM 18566]